MNYTANDLIQTALAEEGYLEKKSNAQLDDKTANAGANNYTKYARDLYEAGYYSGSKQGVAWCSMFVDWCHYIAAQKNKATAQKISCQSGIYGASCTCSMNYYKEAGRFYKSSPKPGDQIYFGSGNSSTHTGLVWKTDSSRVYTVEGNTSSESGVVANGGAVRKKSYSLTDSKILGYGRPRWEQVNPDFTLPMMLLRKGSKGETVKALQCLLEGNACSCGQYGADGQFGGDTEKALKAYQKKMSLETDGVAGPKTWGSLLGITV